MAWTDWQRAAEDGWDRVSRGPDGVVAAVDALIAAYVPPDGAMHFRPAAVFGMLNDWMHARARQDDPGLIYDTVVARVLDHLPFIPGKRVFGKAIERPRLILVSDLVAGSVSDLAGHTDAFHRRGVLTDAQLGLRPIRQIAGYERAAAIRDALLRAIPAGAIARHLQVGPEWVEALITAGFLARFPPGRGGIASRDRLDGLELEALQRLIGQLPEVVQKTARMKTLQEAVTFTAAGLPRVVSIALGDRRLSAVRLAGRRDLAAVHVHADDLKAIGALDKKGMSLPVAWHMLGLPAEIDPASVAWPDGWFEVDPQFGADGTWIADFEMRAFRHTWVLRDRLPTEFGIPLERAIRVLDDAGILPAVDAAMLGAIIYRRADLTNLAWE